MVLEGTGDIRSEGTGDGLVHGVDKVDDPDAIQSSSVSNCFTSESINWALFYLQYISEYQMGSAPS